FGAVAEGCATPRRASSLYCFGGPKQEIFSSRRARARRLSGGSANPKTARLCSSFCPSDLLVKKSRSLARLPISRSPCESRRSSRRAIQTQAARGARLFAGGGGGFDDGFGLALVDLHFDV